MEVMEGRAGEDVAWKMGRIMLKYRPIAPKPLASNPPTTSCLTLNPGLKKRKGGVAKRGRKPKKSGDVVTLLPLMPVTPERKERLQAAAKPLFPPVLSGSLTPARAVNVLVTVESVTGAWSAGFWGDYDEEIKRWLEAGDCPALVSGSGDRVVWMNAAFRRMVVRAESPSCSSSSYSSEGLSGVDEEVRGVLVTRGILPGERCQGFSCMASVRYGCGRGKVSLAVPCDAWRLRDGGLGWRLDVKAALSLCSIS